MELDIQIHSLKFSNVHNLKISTNLLNYQMFKTIKTVFISGIITEFDDEIFKPFRQLHLISLKAENSRNFFHSSLNKWLKYLNFYFNQTQCELKEDENEKRQCYYSGRFIVSFDANGSDLDDKDFCLFKHLPNDRNIQIEFLDTNLAKDPNITSCTMLFLSQTYLRYSKYYLKYKSMIQNCSFENRLEKCFNISKEDKNFKFEFFFNDKSLQIIFMWIEFIGPILTNSIVSLIGFICNLIIILVIKSFINHRH